MDLFEKAVSKIVRKGDIVLDAGAGTGVLSIMAARAGAAAVYAVEKEPLTPVAEKFAEENRCSDSIKFITGDIREVELPEPADGVICEMIGLAGLAEGIRGIMSAIREKLLKPGAWTIPAGMRVLAAPVSDESLYSKIMLDPAPCGLDIETLRDEISHNYWVAELSSAGIPVEAKPVYEIDFSTGRENDIRKVEFKFDAPCEIHGIGCWFEAELAPGIILDTSPAAAPTHWSQCFMPLRHPIKAAPGSALRAGLAGIPTKSGELFHWSAEYIDKSGVTVHKIVRSNALAAANIAT